MHNLSDDAKYSTQLEGKKLTGWGARFGKVFGQLIDSARGIKVGAELDDERGIFEEEIIFDEVGQELEERKKREALVAAKKLQKQGEKVSVLKNKKLSKGKEVEKPEMELKQEKAGLEEELSPQMQKEIEQSKTPVLKEGQQIFDGNNVKQEALIAQKEAKQPEPSVLQSSPVQGITDFAKAIINAVLPTQLPDVREGKGQGGPQL